MRSDPVRIRPATSADSLEVLRWRNDPDSRRNSRDSEIIPIEAHLAWFDEVLRNPMSVLVIGENAHGEPFGQVRFDRMTTGSISFEVSITVSPEARGQGLARRLLTVAEKYFLDTHSSVQLHACVDKDNKVSERLFENAGYTMEQCPKTDGQWWIKEMHV